MAFLATPKGRRQPGVGSLLLTLIALLSGISPASAQTSDPIPGISAEISVGFNGATRAGGWCPVRATLANSGSKPRTLVLSVGGTTRQGGAVAIRRTVDLAPGAKKRIWIEVPVSPSGVADELPIRIEAPDGTVLREWPTPPQVRLAEGYLVLTVGDRALGLAPAPALDDRIEIVSATIPPADLPDHWSAFAGVDAVIWRAPSAGEIDDPAQIRALLDWTAAGGTLVLCGLGDGAALSAMELDPALPGRPAGTVELASVSSLGAFSGCPSPEMHDPVLATRFAGRVGGVLAEERGIPLIVERPYGTGRVIVMTVDPAQPPLAGWAGRDDFWRKLLGLAPEEKHRLDAVSRWRGGEEEALVRSLQTATFTTLPFGRILAMLCIYLLVIGPLDYWMLKRLGHLEWTWFTLPIWVLLFSVVAYAVSARGREEQMTLHELTICDVAPDRRVQWTWTAVCSPLTGPLDASTRSPDSPAIPWKVGGDSAGWILGRALPVLRDGGTVLPGIPAIAWDWMVVQSVSSSSVRGGFTVSRSGEDLAVTNRTGRELQAAVILCGSRRTEIARWAPGETRTLAGASGSSRDRWSDSDVPLALSFLFAGDASDAIRDSAGPMASLMCRTGWDSAVQQAAAEDGEGKEPAGSGDPNAPPPAAFMPSHPGVHGGNDQVLILARWTPEGPAVIVGGTPGKVQRWVLVRSVVPVEP